jgi:PKD repeat protein
VAWQLSVVDASSALDLAGALGVRAYLQSGSTNGPVSFAFDAFTVVVADAPAAPVVADFSWHQESGTLKVDFTDLSSGSPDTWAWDFGDGSTSNAEHPSHTYATDASYQVTLTASLGAQSDSKTQTVVVDPLPPPPPIIYASDNFSRTVSGGWGNAVTGGPWTSSSGSASLSVDGAMGNMSVATGATRAAYLSSVAVQDIDMTTSVQTDRLAVGGAQYLYIVGRHINPTSDYTAKLRFTTNDTVIVGVSRFSASGEAAIGTAVTVPGLTHVAGQAVLMRVQMTGTNPTTIRMKVWQAGTAEPAAWLLTVTDGTAELQTAGAVGIRSYVGGATSNGPVGYSYDDFKVTDPQP